MLKGMSREEILIKSEENRQRLFSQLDDSQKERLNHIPSDQHMLFMSVWIENNSRAKAVKAKCLDCCCYQRNEVRLCEVTLCPLYNFR